MAYLHASREQRINGPAPPGARCVSDNSSTLVAGFLCECLREGIPGCNNERLSFDRLLFLAACQNRRQLGCGPRPAIRDLLFPHRLWGRDAFGSTLPIPATFHQAHTAGPPNSAVSEGNPMHAPLVQ